ncbi:hypothetical protein [Thiorhodovibrio winogradskyi]|uniref:hypothetical protein n=1 Tax=Thiorhodovibrio winogradskyi TaxID=77007 RepID=UPI002E2D6168|nr:hypothetical protein [Thiorhodovibrio winogradskyi]
MRRLRRFTWGSSTLPQAWPISAGFTAQDDAEEKSEQAGNAEEEKEEEEEKNKKKGGKRTRRRKSSLHVQADHWVTFSGRR